MKNSIQKILIFREKVKSFIEKYNRILCAVAKFAGTLITLWSIENIFGTSGAISNRVVEFAMAVFMMFIPFSYSFIIFAAICYIHLLTISSDVALVLLVLGIMIYIIYNRNFMKSGYLAMLAFVLLPTPFAPIIPIAAGVFAGPMGIPPMITGILIYYYGATLGKVMAEVTQSVGTYQLYQMVIDSMLSDKELLLCLVCFIITLLVTWKIYHAEISYAWQSSIFAAGILYAVIYLYGSFLLEWNSSIVYIILSVTVSVVILELIQFFREILDATRAENLEFEDDEYHYYVKVVPKIKVLEEDKNVKKINVQRKSLIRRREKNEE